MAIHASDVKLYGVNHGGIVAINAVLQPEALKSRLRSCGYRRDLVHSDVAIDRDVTIPFAAFAQYPTDSRSACIAVVAESSEPRRAVEACRPLGAPIVFACHQNTLQWWKQGTDSAEYLDSIPAEKLDRFFQANQDQFSPEAIYRAKTLGRVRSEYQLSFVDLGVMPLIEEEVGKELTQLISRNVRSLKNQLGWDDVTSQQGHWVLQTVFWLVSAKVLRDKQVPNFESIRLDEIEKVFARVAKHYGTQPVPVSSKKKLSALQSVAETVEQFSSLALTTTESLAHVYENALISKQTRSALGTHSTPSFLVDYVVGNLSDWIQEIPENERSVFEPACGHAGFLVSAMRLLTQLLPYEKQSPSRRGPYLRKRLHGTEIDAFAVELARLSLTLTDIPNPDGWDLRVEDMFVDDRLETQMKGNSILLANPPFENFTEEELTKYSKTGVEIVSYNKTAEMLRLTLPHLKAGGVFGVVVPQSLLHGTLAEDVRKFLIENYELREVSLFPDKVFNFADVESAILLGRRLPSRKNGSRSSLRFQRIREWQMPEFKTHYEVPSTRQVSQSRFNEEARWDLRVPDLEEVWELLRENPTANEFAQLGQGLIYHGVELPKSVETYSENRFKGSVRGYVRFEPIGVELHKTPKPYWMNLDVASIRRPVTGVQTEIPQILLNYAPVSRGPWRLKALIDPVGRPVTSRFITVRPRLPFSLPVLWAILNSPVSNGFAFSHLGKRDNIVGEIRKIPMPYKCDSSEIEAFALKYFEAANSDESTEVLQALMHDVDAAVLRQYNLPRDIEYKLLSLFDGWERVGVPFKQTHYTPESLAGQIGFAEFNEYERDWKKANRHRGKLIDKKIAKTISRSERRELDRLQAYADYYLEKVAPRSTDTLEELEDLIFSQPSKRDKGSE